MKFYLHLLKQRMLTIQIKNWENKVIAVINNIFSLQVDDEVNKWGKVKIKFPIEQRLQNTQIKKWYRITVNYWIKIWQIIKLFDWYITDITIKTDGIEIQWENWLSYLQNRIIRTDKSYSNVSIQTVVSGLFSELNTTYQLPITLWLNDCDTEITKDFSVWTSFYDILKFCRETEEELVVRVLNWVLEVSKNAGDLLEWIWEYDVDNTRHTNIDSWEWKDTMDNYFSYVQNKSWSVIDSETISDMGLMFERYNDKQALALQNKEAIPSINVSRDTDWRDFNIWDRKHIRLNTGYEWIPLEYLWLIQTRKVSINANWWIKAEIKISDKYKTDTNILDLVLQNLRNWKDSSGWWWWDMSDYYTKWQTTALVNNTVDSKLDVVCTAEEYQQEYWWSSDNRIFFITD